MKVVIASDSYKGSFSSLQVAQSIERGIKSVSSDVDIVKLVIGDGGEGSLEAVVEALDGAYQEVVAKNPLNIDIKARYGILDEKTAFIEMAEASGLTLLKDYKLMPLYTTTYGTGQLIEDALNKGYRKIYVGLGGSATNDGGAGMAMALGVKFLDLNNQEIRLGNIGLIDIERIDISEINPLLFESELIVLSDVNNPLCGPDGAAVVFGPQKGANLTEVNIMDENLKYYGKKIKEILNVDITKLAGAGAAGGLAAGLVAFCKATIVSGASKILEIINLEKELSDADLVITGEGKIDGQTIYGKAPIGVSKLAKKHGVFTLAIVGSIGSEVDKVYDYGIDMIVSIIDQPMTLKTAIDNVDYLIEKAARQSFKTVLKIKESCQ